MKKIVLSPEIRAAAPALRVIHIEADVVNGETCDELWNEILAEGDHLRSHLEMPDIARRPAIAATRAAYKACGKEPNRYRPSAEALSRRMLQGKGLYRISTLVDVINLLSLHTGYSIGGFDCDRIQGDTLTLGIGKHDEPFSAIGRGELNIEFLPVFRDSEGGIGTPTSDADRTKLTLDTKRLLMTVNVYGASIDDKEFINWTRSLLEKYAGAENFDVAIIG